MVNVPTLIPYKGPTVLQMSAGYYHTMLLNAAGQVREFLFRLLSLL
jgi:hypothetical protein